MLKKLLFSILFLLPIVGMASHIVGGEITYKCLGNNNYEFTVNIYRDCLPPSQGGGTPSALAEDNPASICIYKGNSFFAVDSFINFTSSLVVPVNFSNDCIVNPPATCLSLLQFKFSKNLPASPDSYTLIYQRCCRNETVNNIINPAYSGASFYCTIPPSICNNSANYTYYPPQIICVNNPFVYDHSATDADGDSLSYEFCAALNGGDQQNFKPTYLGPFKPNLQSLNYRSPFSPTLPVGGNPILKIDPVTGIITGTPNIQGRFIVTVCCTEWRNGVPINVVRRDFQFVVTNCSKAVVANIPQFSEEQNTYIVSCKSYTVNFVNQSTGGFEYHWDFGVAGSNTDTSNIFQPTFTYPDTGTFKVKLVVNPGSTCPDSITRLVKVYPDFNTDFEFNGLLCPNSPINFTDKTTSTFLPINYWNWNFDDGTSSPLQNPTHSYSNIGKNFVVTLISGNKYGCLDTAVQTLPIPVVNVFAGNDTVIVKNNIIQYNGSGAANYQWNPSDFLDNANINNPTGFYSDTGRYTYILTGITNNGCIDFDTIHVIVSDGPYITLPNAFTPNDDGNNDIFKILASGFKKLNSFKIFDRWGIMIFSTTDFRKGWDGTYKGKKCELGTYFWLVEAIDLNDKKQLIKGDVNLLR